MIKISLLILFFTFTAQLKAQDSLGNITELQKLLKERKDRFEAYANSADERSGIFGNKTKKDLEKSREILLQIVKTDNNILLELDRAISHRGMAKADYSVDEASYKQTIDRLTQASDTLNSQLIAAKESNATIQKKLSTQQWMIYLSIAIIVVLFFVIIQSKRKQKSQASL
jgi:hypothetical protein